MRCVIDEPSDHAGRKLTRYHVVDAMNRRLRDGQLTVKRPHRLSRNRRKDASDLDIYLERVTGIEPALSAWETEWTPTGRLAYVDRHVSAERIHALCCDLSLALRLLDMFVLMTGVAAIFTGRLQDQSTVGI